MTRKNVKNTQWQALDRELGRWEPVKLLGDIPDSEASRSSGKVAVSFLGWGKEYDTEIPYKDIRIAVNPFLEDVGESSF